MGIFLEKGRESAEGDEILAEDLAAGEDGGH